MQTIVLASTSTYRRDLLARLGFSFDVAAPDVEEGGLAGEPPRVTARRLAQAKAVAIARLRADAIVIGSDQVANLDGVALNKPGGHDAALDQLMQLQGRSAVFHTAIAVATAGGNRLEVDCIDTQVQFRRIGRARLDAYLRADRPYDCAGSAKIESLGIVLVTAVQGDDPTALIGLPLIRLTDLLARCGVQLPTAT